MKNLNPINQGLLIRLDDIAENMNWDLMNKCEQLFDQYNIKPLLGVIPKNKDPELLRFNKEEMFWEKIKNGLKKVGKFVCMGTLTSMILRRAKKIFLIMGEFRIFWSFS